MTETIDRTQPSAQASGRLIVALCFSVAVIEGFDIQAIGVAAPRIAPELVFDNRGNIFVSSLDQGIFVLRCTV